MSTALTPANVAKIDKLIESYEKKNAAVPSHAPATLPASGKSVVDTIKEMWPIVKPILFILRGLVFFKPSWQKWLDAFIAAVEALQVAE